MEAYSATAIGNSQATRPARDLMEDRMSFPVLIHQDNGQFVATLAGSPEVRASAPSREEALAGIQTILQERVLHGDLVFVEAALQGIAALAGKYRDDTSLTRIREEIYQARDAEPKE
jgi:hypothetical protein